MASIGIRCYRATASSRVDHWSFDVRVLLILLTVTCMVTLASCGSSPTVPAPTPLPPPTVVWSPTPTPIPTQPSEFPHLTEEQVRWLEVAQLGPFASDQQDWGAIEEAARLEGKLVVYSTSARIQNAARAFMAEYPDIAVETLDRSAEDIAIQLKADREEDRPHCDLLLAGDAALVIGDLLSEYFVWSFVPEEVIEVTDPFYRSPLLVHHLDMNVVVYNFEAFEGPPIDNWWDLTRPEWRGKVVMRNPLHFRTDLYPFLMMIQRADELAQAYEMEFGTSIELDADSPNAGYQWIADFLANSPVFVSGSTIVAERVGTLGQDDPPLGIIPYRRYQDVLNEQFFFEPTLEIVPFAGCLQPSYLAIADRAPHPNAAKLMIRWLMGDPTREDMGGFQQWWNVGEWSPRMDIPVPLISYSLFDLESRAWDLDPHFVSAHIGEVRRFWEAHLNCGFTSS